MNYTDYLHLNEQKIFKELKESLPDNITKSLNLLAVHDNVVFTWDFQNRYLLSLNIKAARSREGENVNHQKLLPLHSPLFSPEFLLVNDIGTLLAIAGPNGILILQLPLRCPPYGAFESNKEVVYCRSHSLDERLLSCSDSIHIRQAKFYPGSMDRNHILVLTSDNTLRLYQISNNEAVRLSVFSIGEKPTGCFPGSKVSFLDMFGETAVDFDFGHPEILDLPEVQRTTPKQQDTYLINAETQTVEKIVPKDTENKKQFEKKWDTMAWPVYILRSDMTVYSLYFDLYQRWKPLLRGPLQLSSFEVNHYEACSMVCLNCVPQIVVIALSNGTVYHSVILDSDDEVLPSKELLAFECVELEMGIQTLKENNEEKQNKYPIFLHKDESKYGRYYATHNAGVHCVTISSADNLQELANGQQEATSDIFAHSSKAEYLVCTKTTSSGKENPVIGFALFYEPTSVIALLKDGSLVTLSILYIPSTPKLDLSLNNEGSPLKKMIKEPLDQYIQKILKKASTQPVLKLATTGEHTQEQCYELLQRATQVFREEYFPHHTKAREELEKRVQTLSMMKQDQLKEIERIKEDRSLLQEKASNLAEKYEDIKDKQDELLKRCSKLIMLVSRKKPQASDAEKVFMNELQKSNEKLILYQDQIDKIKSKMKYQQVQIENWKKQEVKKVSSINETHMHTLKATLTETTKKITEMIKEVNEFKKLVFLH